MDTSSTWSSFSDGLPPPVLYKDAVDAEIINPRQYPDIRSIKKVSLFSVKESKLTQLLDETWITTKWDTAGSQDSFEGLQHPHSLESNIVLNNIRGAIQADSSATQLLLFSYFTGEGPMSRVLDVIGREMSLELDLFLPHLKEREERLMYYLGVTPGRILYKKNFGEIHTAHRFISHRTVLDLGRHPIITAQICKITTAPQKSLGTLR